MATSNWVKRCIFCEIETKNRRHESICKQNPNAQPTQNQYTKAKANGIEWKISDETRKRITESNIGRKHSENTINTIKAAMKKAVKDHPESYSGRYNRGHIKEIICSNGFKVLGSWEQIFVEYCITNKIQIEQPETSFQYEFDTTRQYFPDFYLKDYNCYVEIKGFKTERDSHKWDSMLQQNHKLLIVDKKSIKQVKDNTIKFEKLMEDHLYRGLGSNQ